MRRAFTQARNGRPGPALVEFPGDILRDEVAEPFEYTAAPVTRYGPDAQELPRRWPRCWWPRSGR